MVYGIQNGQTFFSKRLQYHQTTICIDIVSDAITYYFTNDIIQTTLYYI